MPGQNLRRHSSNTEEVALVSQSKYIGGGPESLTSLKLSWSKVATQFPIRNLVKNTWKPLRVWKFWIPLTDTGTCLLKVVFLQLMVRKGKGWAYNTVRGPSDHRCLVLGLGMNITILTFRIINQCISHNTGFLSYILPSVHI